MNRCIRTLAATLLLAPSFTVLAHTGTRTLPGPAAAPPAASSLALAEGRHVEVSSFTEGFDNITTLVPQGWFFQNNSSPVGTNPVWFQGNPPSSGGPFTAHQGAENAYIAVNFNSTAGGTGTISNWMLTPELDFGGSAALSFYTRNYGVGQIYPDRLEVRYSTNGASTNVGAGSTAVGDFTSVLLVINPNLTTTGYPSTWTQFTVTNADGLPRSGKGRIAFRYFVTGAGPTGTNSDYIGIDTMNFAAGAPEYKVSGTVSGLVGAGLALTLNNGTPLAVNANGAFEFPYTQATTYDVDVQSQPGAPAQTCQVVNGEGTFTGDVANVQVTCVTNTYTIGGTVSGLVGSGLVLQNNGGDDLSIATNGSFAFATPLDDLSSFSVTVATDPSQPSQTCGVSNGTGNLAAANVTNVAVTCTTDAFTIGGSVSGLAGSGLVLQNNGGDDLSIATDGSFTFATPLDDLSAFSVTVATDPSQPSQTCAVSNGAGTLAGADVTSVAVTCTTDTFTIGGTVGGLEGSGLVLQNNGGDDLAIATDGSFTFATALDDLSTYSVTVAADPTAPSQTCVVANGEGTVASGAVADIAITCTTNTFTIGGSVSGLLGAGLVLQDNGGDDLAIAADGSFTFATAIEDGATYAVTVLTDPTLPAQTCSVSSGSGTVDGADVTDVQVSCTTGAFELSIVAGAVQAADIGTDFADLLVVALVDANGDPVPDADVSFEAPTTGASAALTDGNQPAATTLSVATDENGEASVLATANDTPGCYGVTATAAGAPVSVVFELTNIDPVPPAPEIYEDGFETPPARAKGLAVCQ